MSHFSRAILEYAPINADGEKSTFLPIARVVSPFIYQFSIRTIFSREGVWETSLPLEARGLLKDEMIGECCGYVACKEKNTGFNCMTEADCDGYTNQGYQARAIHSHPPPTLLLPPHGDEPITEREKPKKIIQRCMPRKERVLHSSPRRCALS